MDEGNWLVSKLSIVRQLPVNQYTIGLCNEYVTNENVSAPMSLAEVAAAGQAEGAGPNVVSLPSASPSIPSGGLGTEGTTNLAVPAV